MQFTSKVADARRGEIKRIIVNGEPCLLVPFGNGAALEPGSVVGQLFGRRVYRVLCADGDDLVLRNARHPDLLLAAPREEVLAEFGLVVPLR